MEEISNETARTAPALLKFRAKVRKVGGNLVVTVPREVAEEEGVKPGELVNIEVRKPKKSFFGIDRGVGPFTRDDEMTDHDSVQLKRTRVGLVVTPTRKTDYLSKFRELIETPPKRYGKPENWKPPRMKKIWKTAQSLIYGPDTNILCYALDSASPENRRYKRILWEPSAESKLGLNPTVVYEAYHTLVFGRSGSQQKSKNDCWQFASLSGTVSLGERTDLSFSIKWLNAPLGLGGTNLGAGAFRSKLLLYSVVPLLTVLIILLTGLGYGYEHGSPLPWKMGGCGRPGTLSLCILISYDWMAFALDVLFYAALGYGLLLAYVIFARSPVLPGENL